MAIIQKITPNLWFDEQAEQAADFYMSIFEDSMVKRITRYGKTGHEIHGMAEGMVMTVEFLICGQEFVALNGGPHFKFNEAISFIVNCDTQEEVDYYWEKLTEGGDPDAQQCGWLKDKFGLSWQIVPTALTDMITDSDQDKAQKALKAMFSMKKIDLETLNQAYEGKQDGSI